MSDYDKMHVLEKNLVCFFFEVPHNSSCILLLVGW